MKRGTKRNGKETRQVGPVYNRPFTDNRYIYMISNHQDDYPYLNMHFFYIHPETSIFLLTLIIQGIPDAKGRGIARDIEKIYFQYKTLKKMVTKLQQFTKPEPFSTYYFF